MYLRFACFVIAGFCAANLPSNARANDAIAATLDTAKTLFTERVSEARQKVGDAFVDAIDRAEGKRGLLTERKIEEVATLKSAQAEFYKSGTLPNIRELTVAVTSYQRVLRIETERVKEAFEDAAKGLATQAMRRHTHGRSDAIHMPAAIAPRRTNRLAGLRRMTIDKFATLRPRAA